jgi:hypothetical protein
MELDGAITHEEVIEASRAALMHEFARDLPKDCNTAWSRSPWRTEAALEAECQWSVQSEQIYHALAEGREGKSVSGSFKVNGIGSRTGRGTTSK